jgi:3-hydroxyacyl-[acyl-carrier-protein] dehydratase
MDQERIKEIIPHRDPMLLVDKVIEIIPEESIVTEFYVHPDRAIFQGHFPGDPVLPGVYTVECMAQSADILLLSMERYRSATPFFIGIDKVKFTRKIVPGDTIEVRVKMALERKEKAIATCSAEVYNHGELAATGEVTLAMRR